jgi:hypothetical protein
VIPNSHNDRLWNVGVGLRRKYTTLSTSFRPQRGNDSLARRWNELLASTPVPANSVPGNKTVVELGDVVRVSKAKSFRQLIEYPRYR